MNLKKYGKYFFFILKHWNLRLACFTIRQEIKGERKYGLDTSYTNNLQSLKVTSDNKEHAYIYQPANYYMLERAFKFICEAGAAGSLVDYGAGMGRIMIVAAAYGFTDIKGVEFAPELCKIAQENLNKVQRKYPDARFQIYCCDATEYSITEKDCVFTFFNPFDERVMLPVIRKLLASLKIHPRRTFVIYLNPTESEIFKSAGFEEIEYYRKMNYLDYSIFLWEPDEGDYDAE
ncbi:MAG: class I SAM-dependent methyltransferase [Chitinophagaceae bacterium]|nr:class I SAM-dependent methyltransferase [Chitinophagaceae bacterium]